MKKLHTLGNVPFVCRFLFLIRSENLGGILICYFVIINIHNEYKLLT